MALARGLSLGLVAVAVFAGAENLAYLIAFQEAGVLARLLWSLPVHLVAALAEALGVLLLFRWRGSGPAEARGRLPLVGEPVPGLRLAPGRQPARLRITSPLRPSRLGVVIANLLFLVLLLQFLRQAYLGGFLHGAD